MNKKGIWISITGIDGAGKTTLGKYMNEKIKNSVFIHLPHYDWVREMLRVSGSNKPYGDPYTDMLIFAASGRLDNYVIKDLISKHKCVVSQRSWIDNFAYRGVQGFSAEEIIKAQRSDELLIPDIIIFIKLDAKTAFNWIKNDKGDKYEELQFMEKLQIEFEKLFSKIRNNTFSIKMDKSKIFILDGRKDTIELEKDIDKILIENEILKEV